MNLYRAIISIRSGVVLLAGLAVSLAAGAVIMPARPATYARINNDLLFDWLVRDGQGADNIWFWAALIVLGVLSLHTVVCSVDALVRGRGGGAIVYRVSPHLMHLGFLLIVLGHLVSSGWGFRTAGALYQGQTGSLPDGSRLVLRKVDMVFDDTGFPRDWTAEVTLVRGGQEMAAGRLGANSPLFHEGVGVYLKSLSMSGYGPVANLVVNRDPGTFWVLAGAVVFTVGNILLLLLKVRRETAVI